MGQGSLQEGFPRGGVEGAGPGMYYSSLFWRGRSVVPSLLQLPWLALPAAADLGKPYFWGLWGDQDTRTRAHGDDEAVSFFTSPRGRV